MMALIRKDVLLHWKHFSMAVIAFIALSLVTKQFLSGKREIIYVQFNLNMAIFGSILFTEWLVVQERARRSILWLRTLPLSDWQIIDSKFVVFALMFWGLVAISILVIAPAWFWQYPVYILRYMSMTQPVGGAILGSRLVFSPKAGMIGPLLASMLVVGVYAALAPTVVPSPVLMAIFWHVPGILISSFVVYFFLFAITTMLMSPRESPSWAA